MLTDIKAKSSKYSMTDSKVRYGSSKSISNSTAGKFTDSFDKELQDFMFKETSRRSLLNPESEFKAKASKKWSSKFDQIPPAMNIKSLVIFAAVLLIVTAVLLFNINIEVEEDL